MTPCGLNPSEVGGGTPRILLGPKDMPDCQPLSIVVQEHQGEIVCLSRWQPTEAERMQIARGGDVLLYVWGWQVPVALAVVEAEER